MAGRDEASQVRQVLAIAGLLAAGYFDRTVLGEAYLWSQSRTWDPEGLPGTASGLLWDPVFPINKNLWTSSYVLFTSGLAALALAACYWVVDVQCWRGWTRPFVVTGTNALALFVVSGWLVKTLLRVRFGEGDRTTTP